jgi:hypothetical protein
MSTAAVAIHKPSATMMAIMMIILVWPDRRFQ